MSQILHVEHHVATGMRYWMQRVIDLDVSLPASTSPLALHAPQVVDDPETDSLLMILENAEGGSLEAAAAPGAPLGSGLVATLPEHTILQHVRDVCKARSQNDVASWRRDVAVVSARTVVSVSHIL